MRDQGVYWLSDSARTRSMPRWVIWLVAFSVFFLAWEIVGRSGSYFAIRPASTALVQLWEDLDVLAVAMAGTLRLAAIGFMSGSLVGLLIGSLVGISRVGRAVVDPVINAGVVTPMTMLIPVIGIYVGFGFSGKLAFVFMFVVFVVAINTSAGIGGASESLKETGRAFLLGRRQIYTKVIFPSALPLILTGLRLAAGRAVQGAIIADLLLQVDHIGRYLIEAGSRFDMPKLLAGTFFTVIIAATVMMLVRLVERRSLSWLGT